MNKRILQRIPSIVLYVIAGLLAVYTIWAFTFCADIISQAKAAGQLAASGNEYDIASFYMGNCGQWLVYAVLMVAAGMILQKKQLASDNADDAVQPAENDADDADDADDGELDEWFDEADTAANTKSEEG
jgi:hypothetical protein